ncbi:MAG: methionyl-tRNA synthetase [Parcubacteria group bacterium Gr01-1014_19]|nr:MAG: methionyl-tRNA synthetase [Parcubacteria group bacterium Gr01-1014_19]
MINYEEFSKTELRVAKILAAEKVEGSDKLLKLQLSAGDLDDAGQPVNRQIVAGIGKIYSPENLVGREIVIVANLEPRALLGVESQGMLLAAKNENGPVILVPEKEVPPGAKIG